MVELGNLEVSVAVFLTVMLVYVLIRIIYRLSLQLSDLKVQIASHGQDLKDAEVNARKDSVKRQRAVLKGDITELVAPWSMTAVNSVSELSFLGNPIDFIGFKGLDQDEEIEIKFIEVKSGKSQLTSKQRKIRDAVRAKRIEWVEVRIKEIEIEER